MCRIAGAVPSLFQRHPDATGFAFYAPSSGSYEGSVMPSGASVGTPEEALDCACGTYLGHPSTWVTDNADRY